MENRNQNVKGLADQTSKNSDSFQQQYRQSRKKQICQLNCRIRGLNQNRNMSFQRIVFKKIKIWADILILKCNSWTLQHRFQISQFTKPNIFNYMKVLTLLLLPVLALQLRINILTTVVINQAPFVEKLNCIDCMLPVQFIATELPSFVTLQNNELKIHDNPQPGQYHLNIMMIDNRGHKAHLLMIIVILNQALINNGNGDIKTEETMLSIQNGQVKNNLTKQLLSSSLTLKVDEQHIQDILNTQARVNKDIANLLILIRRYRNSKSQNERKAAQIAQDLEKLIPSQTAMTQQILLNQNKLSKDKLAIKQLLEFIKKVRKDIFDKKRQESTNSELIKAYTQKLQQKLIEKADLQTTIQLREHFLQNISSSLTKPNDDEVCNISNIQKHNELLVYYEKKESELKKDLSSSDAQIDKKRGRIAELRKEIEDLEKEEYEIVMEKNETQTQLNKLISDKGKSVMILQKLKEQCSQQDNDNSEIRQNVEKLKLLITETKQSLSKIKTEINQILIQIEERTKTNNQINYDIEFLIRQVDQALIDIQELYDSLEEVEKRLRYLMQEKNKITSIMIQLEQELQNLLQKGKDQNQVLDEAKKQLGELLQQKKQIDFEVQQIILNNLDIIKSLKGNGNYKFNLTQITTMTSSVVNFDISMLYEMKLKGQSGTCQNDITYYGIGVISKINGGIINMKGSNNQQIMLHPRDCTISMSTVEKYAPKVGDIICWKGFKSAQKWVMMQNLVFPAL